MINGNEPVDREQKYDICAEYFKLKITQRRRMRLKELNGIYALPVTITFVGK